MTIVESVLIFNGISFLKSLFVGIALKNYTAKFLTSIPIASGNKQYFVYSFRNNEKHLNCLKSRIMFISFITVMWI